MFRSLFVFAVICRMASASLGGVTLPDNIHVNGVALQRNGEGIRSINFFGMHIDVYVAGFYSETLLMSEEDVMECRDSPMQMDFTFLRSVGQGRVTSAWKQQLEESVSYKYDGYEQDRDRFIDMFGPIIKGGTQTVQLAGGETVIVDQGEHRGSIKGEHFQQSFLSMWFGERAVAEDLKAGLLSGSTHALTLA
jgi:hypothetical protein